MLMIRYLRYTGGTESLDDQKGAVLKQTPCCEADLKTLC